MTSYNLDVCTDYNARYQYNKEDAIKINITYSYVEGHFEYLLPTTIAEDCLLKSKNIIIDSVDFSDRKLYDGSYYNYITKATSFFSIQGSRIKSLLTNQKDQPNIVNFKLH